MFQLLVPVKSYERTDEERQSFLRELKRAKVDRVMLTTMRFLRTSREKRDEEKQIFLQDKHFFEENGLKVGAWLYPTIGYGGQGAPFWWENDAHEVYTRIQYQEGSKVRAYCPLDEAFVEDFLISIKDVASTGVDMILFEDDFTLSGGKWNPHAACCCEKHMELLGKRLGRNISREELAGYLTTGGKSVVRDAFLDLQSETLMNLVKKIEKEVHQDYPSVRLGLSANSTSYVFEGAPFPELVKAIAGKNKPFARLTCTPYWKSDVDQTLGKFIEGARLQTRWCGEEVETFSEIDTYPRPRPLGASAYMEHFDMALRADGTESGTLKYMLEYYKDTENEKGYVERHVRNAKHYEEIQRRFGGKKAVGVDIFENMSLYRDTRLGEDLSLHKYSGTFGYLPTASQDFVADVSLPTTYNERGSAHIVFGANAYYVTEEMLQDGVILDAEAARILKEKGVDVGLTSMRRCNPAYEHYCTTGRTLDCSCEGGSFFRFETDESATVLSTYGLRPNAYEGLVLGESYDENLEHTPACYYYENESGQRFLVYAWLAASIWMRSPSESGVFKNYQRQRQILKGVELLQKGRKVPASCVDNPGLYILCKADENSMAVGLWNIFEDEVLDPVIELDGEYSSVDFYHCSGRLEKDKIVLDDDIPAFGFAFFTVYR